MLTISQFFQAIFKPIWEVLIVVPMPWRFTIVILALIPILFWFVYQGLPWLLVKLSYIAFVFIEFLANLLLFGEYMTTQYIRNKKNQPIPKIIYIFNDLLSEIVKIFYKINQKLSKIYYSYLKKRRWLPSKQLFVILGTILPFLWYTRPLLSTNNISKIWHGGETWWYSLEGWVINGKWKTSAASFAPEDFVQNYFSILNDHQYKKAWSLTTAKFKNNKRLMPNGYNDYLNFWKNEIDHVNINAVKLWAKDSNNAKLDVYLQYARKKSNKLSKIETIRLLLIWDIKSSKWLIQDTQ